MNVAIALGVCGWVNTISGQKRVDVVKTGVKEDGRPPVAIFLDVNRLIEMRIVARLGQVAVFVRHGFLRPVRTQALPPPTRNLPAVFQVDKSPRNRIRHRETHP